MAWYSRRVAGAGTWGGTWLVQVGGGGKGEVAAPKAGLRWGVFLMEKHWKLALISSILEDPVDLRSAPKPANNNYLNYIVACMYYYKTLWVNQSRAISSADQYSQNSRISRGRQRAHVRSAQYARALGPGVCHEKHANSAPEIHTCTEVKWPLHSSVSTEYHGLPWLSTALNTSGQ